MIVYGLVLVVHVLVALFLVAVILLQGGRGGLGEALGDAAAQSLFGGGANTVMTKITAVVAGLFMVTCLSLAMLSTRQGGSVIDQMPMSPADLPSALPKPKTAAPRSKPATPAATPVPAPANEAPAPAPSAAPAKEAPATSAPSPSSSTEPTQPSP